MTNRKSTKKALLMSALSLLLCFSMLVGTTFAWFTDEVQSGTNQIVAGNLDVEVYTADGKSITEKNVLFDEIKLWEPGVVAYENITVVNEGNLALKYQMFVNFDNENTVNGWGLSTALRVAVVPGGVEGTREEVLAAAGEGVLLSELTEKGELLKGASQKYGIVIWWEPSEHDNIWNVNNGDKVSDYTDEASNYLHINLGIKLVATQLNAESDSFDPDYDEDAWHPDMVVTTASELAKAIQEVKDGGIIALADNVTFDKDSVTNSGGSWYEGLYYIGDKSFTIDLNGKTITNDSAVNDYLMLFKNDGAKANTITFKNGTIDAASSAYCAICTSTTSTQKITINLENVNLIGNNSNGAVAKIRGGAELNVKAGTVITGKNSYVGIECVNATVNIFDGAEIYQNGTASYVGSLVGVSNNGTVNVYGGYGKSAQGGFIAMTSGGTINVSGGEWIANTDGTYANNNKSVLIAQSDKGAKSTINVTGGTFKGGYNCYGNAVGDATINISNGNFNADPATYVVSGYKAVKNTDGSYTVIFPQESFENLINNAQPGETLNVPAGNFTMSGNNDFKIVGSGKDTVINFTNSIENANISDATISGEPRLAVKAGQSAVFNNVNFEGTKAWGSVQGTAEFVGCTFNGLLHIDSSAETTTIKFKDCTFGAYSIIKLGGSAKYILENCTVEKLAADATGAWGKEWLITYCDTTFTNCELGRVIRAGKTINIALNNCVDAAGAAVTEKIVHTNSDPFIVINGVAYARTAKGLADLVAAGVTTVYLCDGEYDVYGCGGKDLTINGSKNAVIKLYNEGEDGCDYGFGGNGTGVGHVTFNGVTIDTTSNTGSYKGFAYMKGTFNNCNFVGAYSLNNANDFVFNNCTFDFMNGYFWTWAAKSVTFDGCTFNGNSKNILAHGYASTVININNCTFAATEKGYAGGGLYWTAAVEIDPAGSNTYTISFTGENTITDSYAGWTRVKDGSTGHTITGLN